MNKTKLAVCFMMLIGLSASAQEPIQIWGDNPISPKMNRSKLTVFKAKENPSGISVIVCPGGSYQHLDRSGEGYEVAQWLNDNNITAFVLFYRVGIFGNHHPAMIQDLQRSMQLVKENSAEYGINSDRLGVMGFSAGGHLVGTAGTYFDTNFLAALDITPQASLRPAFVTMIYPVVSMTNESIVHKRSRKNLLSKTYPPELAQKMSLELNVRPDMPPVFLIQCIGDKTVDYRNAVNYAAALKEKNVPHKFLLFDEPGHGFGVNPKKGKGAGKAPLWTNLFIPWLEEVMNVSLKTGEEK
jgi:acetyl esterase/lipase